MQHIDYGRSNLSPAASVDDCPTDIASIVPCLKLISSLASPTIILPCFRALMRSLPVYLGQSASPCVKPFRA
jgi:hypothetical protein